MTTAEVAGAASRRRVSVRSVWAVLEAHPVLSIFLIALFTRVLVVAFLSEYFSGTLVFDDQTYHLMAQVAASGGTSAWDEFTHTLYGATSTLLLPVTWLYRIFGPHMIVAQLFVALLGAITAAATTRLVLEFLDRRFALIAGAVVAFLPSQVLWSTLLMKDAAVWAVLTCLAVVVAIGVRATGRKLLAMGVLAAALLVLMAFLRLHTLVVVSWAVMLASLIGVREGRAFRVVGAVAIGILIPWTAGQIGPAGFSLVTQHGSLEDRRFANAVGANTAIVEPPRTIVPSPPDGSETTSTVEGLLAQADEIQTQADEIQTRADEIQARDPARASELRAEAEELEETASELKETATVAIPSESTGRPAPEEELLDPSIRHLPRGLSVMLVEPFPVPFTGTIALKLARVESLFWYPVLILGLYGLWRARHHLRVLAFPLLAAGGILVTYALAEGNLGTAHRHRGEFVWTVAVLAALGLHSLLARRATKHG